MKLVLKALGWLLGCLILTGVTLWFVGPYEPFETDIAFDATTVPDDIDDWLTAREARIPGVKPDATKRVIWAGVPGARTDLVLVYLHGFSATLWETRPLTDRLGEALGANVFYTRLTGHGRDGAALAEARAGDWIEDLAEAMAVAAKLGDRIVVIGTSTGGTLAGLLAVDPALAVLRTEVAGYVFISPNFRVASPAARLLSWPAARIWLPLVAGNLRSFAPVNERHARHTTTEYPTVALLPMQALIDRTQTLDFADAAVPALFWFADADKVVDARATRAVAARWGGPSTLRGVTVPPGDDPWSHVIVGDILSPGGTPAAIIEIGAWLRGL